MKILAFAASSSRSSINRALVRHAAARLRSELLPHLEIEELDLNDYEMAIYSIDREQETGIPEPARRFFEQIGSADGLLIAYAEHNGGYTAAFKNLFDWTSRIEMKVFQGKPVVALATSNGARGGASVLQSALSAAPRFGAEIVASLSVPRFKESFDHDLGGLTDEGLSEQLGVALEGFARRLALDSGAQGAQAPVPGASDVSAGRG